jgi:REP element-mobilizing transposase RayT
MPAKHKPAKRSRPLRVESNEVLWFVTCRVIEERFWLHPILSSGLAPQNRKARRACASLEGHADKRLTTLVRNANARRGPFQPELSLEDAKRIARGLVGSALARAQRHCKVQIFALVVMSNHIHLVVKTRKKNLAEFVGYFKARVAEAINAISGKRGPLWARRYDAQPVVDDEGAADRVGYTLDNPTKANLVDDPEHWPGLNLAFGIGDTDELQFEFLNRTAWHRAKRPASLDRFYQTVTLELSPIPSCKGMPREVYRASVLSWVEASRAKTSTDSKTTHGALGVEKVIHAGFDARPRHASFRKRPYVFGAAPARREHTQAMMEILAGYGTSSLRFRNGERMTPFPEGTYPPPLKEAA